MRDLPSKKLGVDEKDDFTPQYQIIPGKQKVVSKLKEAAASASTIYLAPDPDREGEAIAWHVAEILKDAKVPIHRIQFNEITARAVREALTHPRDINEKLFLSQQARRILDRLVGYKVSPILWQKVKSGISAGRVQSVALRLVVDREKERRAFVPVEYWNFKARLAADLPPEFEAELVKYAGKKLEIGSQDAAEAAEAAIWDKPFVVTAVTEKERKKSPPPPFITSTLQQAANQRLGYSAKRTMAVIREKAGFDVARILEIEEVTRHDVIAFLTAVEERVGPAARFIHLGCTSSDIVDTANGLLLGRAGDIILASLDNLLSVIRDLAMLRRAGCGPCG